MGVLELFSRALRLGLLAFLPEVGAPEPAPASAVVGLLGALVVLGAPALSVALWRSLRTLESLCAAIGWGLASVALVVAATVFSGERAPLLRGYYLVAPLVWISLALTAASLGGRYLGSSIKARKALPAIVVLALGVVSFQQSFAYIASPAEMWKRVAAADPGNESAIASSQPDPRTAESPAALLPALDACIARKPRSCVCLTRRAAALSRRAATDASADALLPARADVLVARDAGCALDEPPVRLREIAVKVFSSRTDADAELEQSLDGAKDRDANPILLYGDAILALHRGDAARTFDLAKRASEAGQASDAKLLYASLLMSRGNDAEARPVLVEILRRDPAEPKALYDLALVDDHAGDFNKAREGYLAALRADPTLRDARYNLAMLTLRRGIRAEAKHHAEDFVRAYPDDPRGETLLKITGGQ